jgi:hypothetical protein
MVHGRQAAESGTVVVPVHCLELVTDMSDVLDTFARWWNYLAQRNGKLKFRTQREAAEFVRRVQNENGGPNAKIVAMRRRYDDVTRARADSESPRPYEGGHKTVLR